jgi:hypothetical protein
MKHSPRPFEEISVPTASVPESLMFYRRLGAVELATNDIRNYAYAAISLGDRVIGLHSQGLDEAAITRVHPDLAAYAREQRACGVRFEFTRLGDDQFNEVGWRDAEGVLQILMEARTHTGSAEDCAPVFAGASAVTFRQGRVTLSFVAPELREVQRWLGSRDLEASRKGHRLVLLAPEGTTVEWAAALES